MKRFPLDEFPVLHTKNLILRKFQDSDAPGFFLIRSNPELMKFIPRPLAQTEQDALELLRSFNNAYESGEHLSYAIELKATQEFIGSIGYYRIDYDSHRTEVGYILSDKHHRKGYVKEALQMLIDFAFNEMEFHSLEAVIDPENIASIKLVESLGFIKEAHFKENGFFNGKYLDALVYSLLNK